MTDQPVTRYDAHSQRVTNDVCNAAPHHTTPHHTTKNTSSRSMALATVIETLRPEWSADSIARALAADDRPWRTVVLAALRGATETQPNGAPVTRHPNGLRYVNADDPADVPVLPTVAEALNPQLDDHGFPVGRCPVCRRSS